MIYKIEVERYDEWEKRGRYLEIEAKDVHEAMEKARKEMSEDEGIYQITANGQIVYDFFNGCSIYPDVR